jgi:hypothetical protein
MAARKTGSKPWGNVIDDFAESEPMKFLCLLLIVAALGGCLNQDSFDSDPVENETGGGEVHGDGVPAIFEGELDDGPCRDFGDKNVENPHASAVAKVSVTLRNAMSGSAIPNQPVVAMRANMDAYDVNDVFDMAPFFNECLLVIGVTNEEGVVDLGLPSGTFHIGYPGEESDAGFTSELLPYVQAIDQSRELLTFPQEIMWQFNGSISNVGVPTLDGNDLRAEFPSTSALTRLDTFSPDVEVSWTNVPLLFADLYLGLAIRGSDMFTDDFFNDEQGPTDGPVTEDLFGAWIDYGRESCSAMEKGLDVLVYDAGPMFATSAAPLAFTATLDLELEGYAKFISGSKRGAEACGLAPYPKMAREETMVRYSPEEAAALHAAADELVAKLSLDWQADAFVPRAVVFAGVNELLSH